MRHLALRERLTLQWTASFGLLLAFVAGTIYLGTRSYLYADLQAQLLTLATTEVASSTDGPYGIHLHEFSVASADRLHYVKFVQILSLDGEVLLQTPGLTLQDALLDTSSFQEALRGAVPMTTVSIDGRSGRVTALATETGGERYVVAVGVYTDHLESVLEGLGRLLGVTWLVGLVLTGGVGFALSSRALAPVARIASQAATITRGNFSTRLDQPQFDDEIGRMTLVLNEMLDRLEQAVHANQRFAADASHELRGPLTAIRGEVDVTLRQPRTPSEYRQTLEQIGQRTDDLTALTSDLTLLVRVREGSAVTPIEEVPLVPLIQASTDHVSDLAASHEIGIQLEGFPDLVAYANQALLSRVFENLLRNAVQYNRAGGVVAIRGAVEVPESDAWQARAVIVRIRDSGIGIPPRDLQRVFERFYRVDRSRSRRTGGTGLGLAICRETLALFHGTVEVAESSEQGTTIEVRLPGTLASDAIVDSMIDDPIRRAEDTRP